MELVEKLFSILSSDTVDISLRRSAAEQLSVVLQSELPLNNLIKLICCIIVTYFWSLSSGRLKCLCVFLFTKLSHFVLI